MPIVSNTQPGTFVNPGSYIAELAQSPPQPSGPNTSLVGIVGTANYGPLNTPTYFSQSSLYPTFGNNTALPHSIADAVVNGLIPESSNFLGTRVSDGTDLPASVLVSDNTGFATETITISGSAGSGQTAIVTLVNGSVTVNVPSTGSYAIPTGQTATATAIALAGLINTSAAVLGSNAFLQPAAQLLNAINTTALASGTGGNSITISVAISGAGQSATPTSTTAMSGGATPGILGTLSALHTGSYPNASSVIPTVISGYRIDWSSPTGSTSPVAQLTTYFPGTTEVFTGIIAYATAGGGFDATTFKANVAAAINTGTSTRAASQYWSWTSGSSTASPLVGTYRGASGGTDGATGVTTSILLAGLTPMHNMLSAGQVMISQLTDCTAAQALATFCSQENCLGIIDLGLSGTQPSTAVTTKAANNVNSRFLVADVEWGTYLDPYTGLPRLSAPSSTIMGVIAGLNPWDSPLNKPTGGKSGLISTEWTTGTFPDTTTLQINNVCFIALENGNLVVWNDNCSDGTPIADTRMTNYIAYQLQAIGAPFIGQLQSTAANDPVRTAYFNAIRAFLGGLANPNNPKINTFNVDPSGNTPTTIQNGFLIGKTTVQTLRGIRYVLNIIQVGSQIVVQQP